MISASPCLLPKVWGDPGWIASGAVRGGASLSPQASVGFAAKFAGFPPILRVMFLVQQETRG
jgi:hypothetical protein